MTRWVKRRPVTVHWGPRLCSDGSWANVCLYFLTLPWSLHASYLSFLISGERCIFNDTGRGCSLDIGVNLGACQCSSPRKTACALRLSLVSFRKAIMDYASNFLIRNPSTCLITGPTFAFCLALAFSSIPLPRAAVNASEFEDKLRTMLSYEPNKLKSSAENQPCVHPSRPAPPHTPPPPYASTSSPRLPSSSTSTGVQTQVSGIVLDAERAQRVASALAPNSSGRAASAACDTVGGMETQLKVALKALATMLLQGTTNDGQRCYLTSSQRLQVQRLLSAVGC